VLREARYSIFRQDAPGATPTLGAGDCVVCRDEHDEEHVCVFDELGFEVSEGSSAAPRAAAGAGAAPALLIFFFDPDSDTSLTRPLPLNMVVAGASFTLVAALIERPALPGSSALPRLTCIGRRVTFVGHFGNGFVENLTGRSVDLDRLLLHCRAAAYCRADVQGRRAREENEEARAPLPAPTGGGGGGAADSGAGEAGFGEASAEAAAAGGGAK
jgi:hypothetical protein